MVQMNGFTLVVDCTYHRHAHTSTTPVSLAGLSRPKLGVMNRSMRSRFSMPVSMLGTSLTYYRPHCLPAAAAFSPPARLLPPSPLSIPYYEPPYSFNPH